MPGHCVSTTNVLTPLRQILTILVLGGQKISGADIRDQNGGNLHPCFCSSKPGALLKMFSACDTSHRKCSEELIRPFGPR